MRVAVAEWGAARWAPRAPRGATATGARSPTSPCTPWPASTRPATTTTTWWTGRSPARVWATSHGCRPPRPLSTPLLTSEYWTSFCVRELFVVCVWKGNIWRETRAVAHDHLIVLLRAEMVFAHAFCVMWRNTWSFVPFISYEQAIYFASTMCNVAYVEFWIKEAWVS